MEQVSQHLALSQQNKHLKNNTTRWFPIQVLSYHRRMHQICLRHPRWGNIMVVHWETLIEANLPYQGYVIEAATATLRLPNWGCHMEALVLRLLCLDSQIEAHSGYLIYATTLPSLRLANSFKRIQLPYSQSNLWIYPKMVPQSPSVGSSSLLVVLAILLNSGPLWSFYKKLEHHMCLGLILADFFW